MLAQHSSQMFEWQPYTRGTLNQVPSGDHARLNWLRERYAPRDADCANRYREVLVQLYGAEVGAQARYAEAFECSEYGAPLTEESRRRLFPFLP